MSKPVLLVCNDDGIGSPGLRAAVRALHGLGRTVVVAPTDQRTAAGRSLVSRRDAVLEPVGYRIEGRPVEAYRFDGSPAMAVQFALAVLFSKRTPQLVVSGVNYGENLGSTITSSGTVGAALEAASYGIPALAVSRQTEVRHHFKYGRLDWGTARHFTRRFAKGILRAGLPGGAGVLNVTIPATAKASTPWVPTRMSSQPYFRWGLAKPSLASKSGDGKVRVDADLETLEEDSDIFAVLKGRVSVTPLGLDLTSRAALPLLAAWLMRRKA